MNDKKSERYRLSLIVFSWGVNKFLCDVIELYSEVLVHVSHFVGVTVITVSSSFEPRSEISASFWFLSIHVCVVLLGAHGQIE